MFFRAESLKLLLLSVAVLLALPTAEALGARAKWTGFDPASCPADSGGAVFVAYGALVVRLHARPMLDFRARAEEDQRKYPPLLTPPEPGQPLGCRGNPIQVRAFELGVYDRFGTARALREAKWPYSARALGVGGFLLAEDYAGGDEYEHEVKEHFCEDAHKYGVVIELENGLSECIRRPFDQLMPEKGTRPPEEWERAYIARPGEYTVPSGAPFMVLCKKRIGGNYQVCAVRYELQPGLPISYAVTRREMPTPDFTDFVTVDGILRAAFAETVLRDYEWPDAPPPRREWLKPPAQPAEGAIPKQTYDPATCPTDTAGMIYVVLGEWVLRFPAELVREFELKPEEERKKYPALLTAPDPAAALGCFENPIQLNAYRVTYAGDLYAGQFGLPQQKWPYPRRAIYKLMFLPFVPGGRDQSQSGQLEFYCGKAREHGLVTELENGLTECVIGPQTETLPAEGNRPPENWARAYFSRPGEISTLSGRPFIAICGYTHGFLVQTCRVSYDLMPNMHVTYLIKRGWMGTPDFTDFAAVDRVIRGPLDGALVENYEWPEPAQPVNPE